MKVLYDHQIFENQKIGGISRYFYELINRIDGCSISLENSENAYIQNCAKFGKVKLPDQDFLRFMKGVKFPGKRKVFNALHKIRGMQIESNLDASIRRIRESKFSVFHPTYYDTYFLEYLKKPYVLTVYDMIHEKYPELFSLSDNVMFAKKKLIENASAVIAISNTTKNDIMEIYGTQTEKIKVVYLASDLYKGTSTNIAQNMPYILFTGARGVYKNFYFMIVSIADTIRKNGFRVICTGSQFSFEEKNLFKELKIEHLVEYRYTSENELHALYRNAICFIFPSYYEGFGLPILEAFEAGCPVLLANTACFKEIAEDAAIFFDIKGKNSLVEALETIVNNNAIRKKLIDAGFRKSKEYSWEKTTSETIKVYESVC